MKVLYVTGACLTKNTSANMSHNAFVKGLLDNGCELDILMAGDSWGQSDPSLHRWDNAKYHIYDSVSVADKVRAKMKAAEAPVPAAVRQTDEGASSSEKKMNFRQLLRAFCKKAFYFIFPNDPLYPLEKYWLKQASAFRSSVEYDLVLSNSSPAAGHRLVELLLQSGRLKCKRWVQVWEDPWYYDLYGGHSEIILAEEHRLLQAASEVYYVSPLTLMYQKRYFPDCADKMKCVPLPFLQFENAQTAGEQAEEELSCGYFGDYYSVTRNLLPFYQAARELGIRTFIYGDTDVILESTEQVTVSSRITLDKLSAIQSKTKVLVHLCNLSGGQIPGKIYHYSATDKPILFILDGTEEEQQMIKSFFEKYDRYQFCRNEREDIKKVLESIISNVKKCHRVAEFEPQNIAKIILEG